MYLHGLRQTMAAYGCVTVKVRERELGLWPKLYAGPVCDDSAD